MAIRCRLGFHRWAWFGPWYGGFAGNRVCKRCGRHEARYIATGDMRDRWHHEADNVNWPGWQWLPPRRFPEVDDG